MGNREGEIQRKYEKMNMVYGKQGGRNKKKI
jgi:hypothetical protein